MILARTVSLAASNLAHRMNTIHPAATLDNKEGQVWTHI